MDVAKETRWERFKWWAENGDPNGEVGKAAVAIIALPLWLPLALGFGLVMLGFSALVLAVRCLGKLIQCGRLAAINAMEDKL